MIESVQMYAPNAKNMVQKYKWSSFNKFAHFIFGFPALNYSFLAFGRFPSQSVK